MRIHRNQVHDAGGADEAASAASGAAHESSKPGAKGKTAASKSDPTGLGWRAKLTAHAAPPASHAKGPTLDAEKAQVEKALNDAYGSPKHAPLKSVPASVRAAVAAYQKRDDATGEPDGAFAWKTTCKGQTLYVAQESDEGPYMLTVFDKSGKKLAEGEVNSDEDLGINW